jgi:glutathione synthase/RimK-type ligase-like ATP-grasp enzyme
MIISDAVDYRFARAPVGQMKTQVDLPADVRRFVRELHDLLGVAFLGVDFKIDVSKLEWYFLEANSMPAFHGYDLRANGRISDLLARYLFRR